MENYNNNTRHALQEERKAEERLRCSELSGLDSLLAQAVQSWHNNNIYTDWFKVEKYWSQGLDAGKYSSPSDFFRSDYKKGMEAFVPLKHRPTFLYIIDQLNKFQCAGSRARRTMRTARYQPHLVKIIPLLKQYSELYYYDDGIEDLLLYRMDEEKMDYLRHNNIEVVSPYMIAAELDMGNQEVRAVLKEAILSDVNNVRVNISLIKGILFSNDREMHTLLGKFLLAARLQEGLRQAICENMDCGTSAGFRSLFRVIVENNLIRFPSVKRSIATWTGLYNEDNLDRLTAKEIQLMLTCLDDPEECRRLISSRDPVEIHLGLWAMGAYEIEDALAAVEELAQSKERPQVLAAFYFLLHVEEENKRSHVAARVLTQYADDTQLCAFYLSSYLPNVDSILNRATYKTKFNNWNGNLVEKLTPPVKLPLSDYFSNQEEAESHYRMLERFFQTIPPKGLSYDPCIFPWYQIKVTRMEVLQRMCLLAWLLQDEKKLEDCGKSLAGVSTNPFDQSKRTLMRLIFLSGDSPKRREALITILKNSDAYSSTLAFRILDQHALTPDDYQLLEGLLSSKRDALRANVECLLIKRGDSALSNCVERLLAGKGEPERTAGLDLVRQLGGVEGRGKLYTALCATAVATISTPTDKERILLGELIGEESEARRIENTPGFGIYDPTAAVERRSYPYHLDEIQCLYDCPEDKLVRILYALDALIKENAQREYREANGDEVLLGSGLLCSTSNDWKLSPVDQLPFPELWRGFYAKEVESPALIFQLSAYLGCVSDTQITNLRDQSVLLQTFGSNIFKKSIPYRFEPVSFAFSRLLYTVIWALNAEYEKGVQFSQAVQVANAMADHTTARNVIGYGQCLTYTHPLFDPFLQRLQRWHSDEEFTQAFFSRLRLNDIIDQLEKGRVYKDNLELKEGWYLKAWQIGLITKDAFYKELFVRFGLNNTLSAVSRAVARCAQVREHGYYRYRSDSLFECLITRDCLGSHSIYTDEEMQAICDTIYSDLVPVMLKVELKRGDPETVFSRYIFSICTISGVNYLMQILMALGGQTLNRGSGYRWNTRTVTRQEVLSHLLSCLLPRRGRDGGNLGSSTGSHFYHHPAIG